MSKEEIFSVLMKNGYEIKELIGSGGYSDCYKVYSVQYNCFFVCKIISLIGENSESKKKSFDSK